MENMFSNIRASYLSNIIITFENINTPEVKSMENMFSNVGGNCTIITFENIISKNLQIMKNMFDIDANNCGADIFFNNFYAPNL